MELSEGCLSDILFRTTPLDVARNSVVSRIFCSAADSDNIWNHFLPSDYHSIISQPPSLANAPSKKALYLALSYHHIIIDQGIKSFQLDKKSGKKCYMLASRSLHISRSDDERYCVWVTLPESRFEEVAKLKFTGHGICGKINVVDLSSNTQYAAFLVFKLITNHGYFHEHVMLSIHISGGPFRTKEACLDMKFKECMDKVMECPNVRSDGLLEIEIGEFFNSNLEDGEVEMRALIFHNIFWKGNFYIEGVELGLRYSR